MKAYKIFIVEDEPLIAESLQDILECLDHEVLGISDNGPEAIESIKEHNPDLIMLDIQIKGDMDGIQVAEELKDSVSSPFIFTTAFADNETIDRARDQGPYGYVVKPYGINDIKAAIEVAMMNFQAFEELRSKQNVNVTVNKNNQLFIKTDSRLVRVKDEDILYVEAKGDYVLFKTKEKGHIVHSTMKNIEANLNPEKFIRVHRSYIINLNEIVDIEDSTVLIEKKVIPVSRSHKEALMKRINLI